MCELGFKPVSTMCVYEIKLLVAVQFISQVFLVNKMGRGDYQERSQLIVCLSMLQLELYSQQGDNLRSGGKVFKEKGM